MGGGDIMKEVDKYSDVYFFFFFFFSSRKPAYGVLGAPVGPGVCKRDRPYIGFPL